MDNIIFQGRLFPLREIEVVAIGRVLISTTMLGSKLLNKDGSYYSEESRILDEDIYYYVDSNEINFSEEQLLKTLNKII